MPINLKRRDILQAAALLPGLLALSGALRATPVSGFTHSVASGDPTQDGVVLWTRYVGKDGGPSALKVEVAEDAGFARIITRGTAVAGPETDYCAHASPAGLRPGSWYYYRFVSPSGETSPVGRTRTLPVGTLEQFRLGVFSCANATSGWFNAYGHAAAREDLDLIVHLGDYIYESPTDRSDAIAKLAVERDIQPRGAAVSLADYRMRYASYRNDPGLQELHRRYPMVVMWDDHETANNSWHDGAKNHGTKDGPWSVRKEAGVRAFREWLPMRPTDYSRYQIGDLATMFRLETRLLARSRQLDLAKLAFAPDLAAAARAFCDGPLSDPARTMMGATQEKWLADGLAESVQGGTRWQILAQQVVMAPSRLPTVTSAWFAPGDAPSAKEQAEMAFVDKLHDLDVPTALDRWDGYPAARERLFESVARANAHLAVLSGDSHNAWAFELERKDKKPVGVEFAGQSVSSFGIDKRFGGNPDVIARDFIASNPDMKWCDVSRRGYMVTQVTRDAVTNDWLFLASKDTQSIALLGMHRMVSPRGSNRLEQA